MPLRYGWTQSALAQEHAETLREAFAQSNRWEALPEHYVRDYVLPLTSLGEDEVAWLPILQPIANDLTQSAKTPLEAARLINRHLWHRIGVIYSTKREKANQDPLHSIRLGMASCSGLSILLADACRSVGIPARLVGCMWKYKPGNHTWVEIWSEGEWYPLGAFEDRAPEDLWFLEDAAMADASDERYAIYATCATSGDRLFYGWGVSAIDVTARYAKAQERKDYRVFFAVERDHVRISVPFVVDGVQYRTPSALQDLNDYAIITLPERKPFDVEIEGRTYHYDCAPNTIIVEQLPECGD